MNGESQAVEHVLFADTMAVGGFENDRLFDLGNLVVHHHKDTCQLPVLDFQGVPSGIDVTQVCRTGILPQINTGMAGRLAGVGQVGAGLVTPPVEIFPKALAELADRAIARRQWTTRSREAATVGTTNRAEVFSPDSTP